MANRSTQSYQTLRGALSEFLPESRCWDDPLRTLAYGTDASFYRLTPKIVVEVSDEAEVSRTLKLAAQHKAPITFRAAGTSLSGQSITDSVLMRLGQGWREWQVSDDATSIRLQPGVIGSDANRYLAPHGRKIGPDPASIDSAKVGGIAANNASGMCCGVAQNSYQTLESMRLILADGTLVDTGDAESRERFRGTHGKLLEELEALAQRTRADAALAERIRNKFKIKNTTGYSLNALVDYTDPFEILQHLMIGSEGTLGFIAEITLRTVPDHPHKASSLAFFADAHTAARAVAVLKSQPVAAVEMMDRAALRSVETKPGMPETLRKLPEKASALLIESRASSPDALGDNLETLGVALADIETLTPLSFTNRAEEYGRYWKIRKGLFPAVGAVRASGTTVIIEDVAFPVPELASGTMDLQSLFKKHGYDEAIIFGHALEGNLHFVITQSFDRQTEVDRYHRFMDEICHTVVEKYDGSLKAEHSTGRNIAPYVELEWGSQAYGLMRDVKSLLDPEGILNPGVILNDDPDIHIKNLKPMPAVDPLVDKCIECGFCEPNCPSRALTLTPRQRIVGLREMARLESVGAPEQLDALREAYAYMGVTTCAGDSLCSIACPVDIDTGKMMKTLRGRGISATGQKVAKFAADHFEMVATGTRVGLGTAQLYQSVLGPTAMGKVTGAVRRLSGGRVPQWNAYLPKPARAPRARQSNGSEKPCVVYFPSCASRTMGPAKGDPERDPLSAKVESVLAKAGFEWRYPEDLDGLCCGMPFESKGVLETGDAKLRELESALSKASDGGKIPILFDTSPCTGRIVKNLKADLEVRDLTAFIHDELMARLEIEPINETVAIHATCSNRRMEVSGKLAAVARACSKSVVIPEDITCCGWAGDKGFTVPELTASALRNLKATLPDACRSGYSTSRTCEIGLSQHSGRHYRSIVYLVDRCSRPRT